MRAETVFYSWQADLPNRTNRTFIEDALERAAKTIHSDDSLKVELRIDRDTANTAGSPAIADTILQKIAAADVFVPDVSIVATTSEGKACPNPNVLLELGYAVSQLGWDRIIMVMNTAFGPITQLPFDLRGRRVLSFCLPDPPSSTKADERRTLENKLVTAITKILSEQTGRAQIEQKQHGRILTEWASRFRDDRIHAIRNRERAASNLASDKLICVHFVPAGSISEDIALQIHDIERTVPRLAPFGSTGFNTDFNGDGLCRVDPVGDKTGGYLQLFRNGVIESVNSTMLTGRRMRDDGLPSQPFAMSLGSFISHALEFCNAVKVEPPACLLISLLNLKGASLLQPFEGGASYSAKPFDRDDIQLPAILIEDFNSDPKPLLRATLDALWQHAGEDRCPYFSSDGTWTLRVLY